jgi:hypothetical protein
MTTKGSITILPEAVFDRSIFVTPLSTVLNALFYQNYGSNRRIVLLRNARVDFAYSQSPGIGNGSVSSIGNVSKNSEGRTTLLEMWAQGPLNLNNSFSTTAVLASC